MLRQVIVGRACVIHNVPIIYPIEMTPQSMGSSLYLYVRGREVAAVYGLNGVGYITDKICVGFGSQRVRVNGFKIRLSRHFRMLL